jgi:hypothetical protein
MKVLKFRIADKEVTLDASGVATAAELERLRREMKALGFTEVARPS